jgi:6-pyruvoyl-tetrahydropterin synthase
MKLELVVTLTLEATHSLEEREKPHSHRWDIQVGLKGDLERGRVVSLTHAQELLSSILKPLQNTFLNNNDYLDSETRACPTCENIALFLLNRLKEPLNQLNSKNPPALSFIQVGIWDKGVQLGFARLSL